MLHLYFLQLDPPVSEEVFLFAEDKQMLDAALLSALRSPTFKSGKGKSPWSSRRDRRYLVSSSWSGVLVCSVTKYKHKSYHIAAPPRPIMFLLFSSLVLKCQQQKDILFRAVYTIFFFLSLRVLGVHCCGKQISSKHTINNFIKSMVTEEVIGPLSSNPHTHKNPYQLILNIPNFVVWIQAQFQSFCQTLVRFYEGYFTRWEKNT